MITVYPVLRQRMREHGISYKDLAKAAGITLFACHLKMLGIMQWNLTEVVNVCCIFSTPDAEHLFVRNHSKSQFLESQGGNYHL